MVITYRFQELLFPLIGREMPSDYWYTQAIQATFRPEHFLERIKPGKRMAARLDPFNRGWLQTPANKGIFLSGGRSIILHAKFREYLLTHDIINIGWHGMTYYVTSAEIDKLSLLGIKYVMTFEPSSDYEEYRVLASFQRRSLLENPRNVSLAYLACEDGDFVARDVERYEDQVHVLDGKYVYFLKDEEITCAGNDIVVSLPLIRKECDLVLTFVNWPGWKAVVDSRPVGIKPRPDCFLSNTVAPGDSVVKYSFEPFSTFQVILFPLLSAGIVVAVAYTVRAGRPLSHEVPQLNALKKPCTPSL